MGLQLYMAGFKNQLGFQCFSHFEVSVQSSLVVALVRLLVTETSLALGFLSTILMLQQLQHQLAEGGR